MANPFDFNEDEASRNFEKSVIFGNTGTSPRGSEARDFMKTSLAAANMLHDEDVNDDFSSISMSVRGSAAYSNNKKQQRPPPKYNTADLLNALDADYPDGKRSHSNISKESSYMGLDDHVHNKPQVSAVEFQRISEELRNAKRTIENMKSEKWKSPPVRETVHRMVTGKDYFLEGYKALNQKQELLSSTVRTNDGNAIINVVLFLAKTLKPSLFIRELRKQTSAFSHYAFYLRQNEEWDRLENLYHEMCMVEDAATVRYEQICQEETETVSKVQALQNWIRDYGLKQEVTDMSSYIKDEISLLEKQRQIDEEDKKRFMQNANTAQAGSTEPVIQPQVPKVTGRPLITTISYCARYHFDNKSSRYYPEHFKKTYQLTDKQYEWAVLPPRINLRRWNDVQELLTSTSWLKKKSESSAIGFEHVCAILHKANADAEILNKYLFLIGNADLRIKHASKFNAHHVVIETLVQTRDRDSMEAYRLKVGQQSQYRQKINDLLNNTSIKWR
ncbi:spermatogenesis-defective protein 39 homolog isoform X1 [Clytia hemisphaerica]|uniref:Vps16 C-terminal domain-containing protein n=1 Tax=Clytia hemisphaerica TaxID=252671 RepID=A0A7M5UR90_9CNID